MAVALVARRRGGDVVSPYRNATLGNHRERMRHVMSRVVGDSPAGYWRHERRKRERAAAVYLGDAADWWELLAAFRLEYGYAAA